MLKERAKLVAAGLMLGDLLATTASFGLAYYVRSVVLPARELVSLPLLPLSNYLVFLALGLALWAIALVSVGAYASHRTQSFWRELSEVTKASGIAGLLFIVLIFVAKLDERVLAGDRLSRALIISWVLFAAILLVAERALVRWFARDVRRRGRNYRSIIIVGTSELGREIARSIIDHEHWGLRVTGFIDIRSGTKKSVDGVPILGNMDDLLPLTESTVIDEVIIADTELPFEATHKIVRLLSERGICARVGLLDPHAGEHATIEQLGRVPLLSFDPTRVSDVGLFAKRCVDLALAIPLTLLLLPVIAFVAVAIRGSSPGGILFRQTRVGLRGRRFTLLKFRTMRTGAENDRGELEHRNEMTGPVFKVRNDPRVTSFGRFLRRFSLDELPQLWNVVKGDMSLVGPRPPTPEEVEQYKPRQRRRLSMRPGLTCLWQVTGRNEIDFDRWVALDLEYIDNWSPWLDVKILFKTVPAVFSGRGAF